jgi:hypothetical protein
MVEHNLLSPFGRQESDKIPGNRERRRKNNARADRENVHLGLSSVIAKLNWRDVQEVRRTVHFSLYVARQFDPDIRACQFSGIPRCRPSWPAG